MALTTSLLSEHRRELSQVVYLAERDLRRLWATLPLDNAPRATETLVRTVPVITDTYGEVAATLAADLYDEARTHSTPYRAFAAPPAPLEQVQILVRWAVTPIWSEAPDAATALQRLTGGAERLVLDPHRRTIHDSAKRDPVRTGYARHPNPGACDFCLMLASRKDVYPDKRTALRVVGRAGRPRGTQALGEKYHDNCLCTAVPIFSPDDVPDVNRRLHRIWQDTTGSNDDKRQALVEFFAAQAA